MKARFIIFFGIIFSLVGVLIFWHYNSIISFKKSAKGKITNKYIYKHTEGDILLITIEFFADGKKIKEDCILNKDKEKTKVGDTLDVYYSPGKPHEIIMKKENYIQIGIFFILFGFFILAFGAFLILKPSNLKYFD